MGFGAPALERRQHVFSPGRGWLLSDQAAQLQPQSSTPAPRLCWSPLRQPFCRKYAGLKSPERGLCVWLPKS